MEIFAVKITICDWFMAVKVVYVQTRAYSVKNTKEGALWDLNLLERLRNLLT